MGLTANFSTKNLIKYIAINTNGDILRIIVTCDELSKKSYRLRDTDL
jgi:hypothetical protein